MVNKHQPMCESTRPHAAAGGRRVVQAFTLLAFSIPLFLASCNKKSDVANPNALPDKHALMRDGDDAALEANIKTFYTQMKAFQADPKSVSGTSTIANAELMMEATYNYYVARTATDEHVSSVEFSLQKPAGNEGLTVQNVAQAFWDIKDSLTKQMGAVRYSNKSLAGFDLEVTLAGSTAQFTVRANITDGPGPDGNQIGVVNGKKYLTTATNHAYSVWSNGLAYTIYVPGTLGGYYNYGYGQADLDIPNKSLVPGTKNLMVPDAKSMIRTLGKYNTFAPGFATASTNLVTGIHSVDISAGNTASLPSPYNVTPGFDQNDIYRTVKFYSGTGQTATLNDPDTTFKDWLSTPLMNTYIAAVPTKLSAALPSGKSYYDFNIGINFCTCFPGNNTGQYNGVAYLPYNYYYRLAYGDETTITLPPRTTFIQF